MSRREGKGNQEPEPTKVRVPPYLPTYLGSLGALTERLLSVDYFLSPGIVRIIVRCWLRASM